MDRTQLAAALTDSLDDRRLSRAERKSLRHLFTSAGLSAHERNWLRSEAFQRVSQSLERPEDRRALEWLQDVVGLALSVSDADTPRSEPSTAAFSPGDDCRRLIERSLDAAMTSIDLCVFTITDDRITAAVAAAHKRGVAVRVVSDDDKSLDRGSDLDRLRNVGIPVAMDDSDDHMHHKFALFDRKRLLTGSYNWTRSAFERNQENVVLTTERPLIDAFQREFDRLWRQFGRS